MDTPTTKQFRIGEMKAIIAEIDALRTRAENHRLYLADPRAAETHRADCRDNDVVCTNLALAIADIENAKRQLSLALKLTDTPDPQPVEETPEPTPEAEEPTETA